LSRLAQILLTLCFFPLIAVPAVACSAAGCAYGGIEMRRDFTVKIRHGSEPVLGAIILISGPQGKDTAKKLAFETDPAGVAHIAALAPGYYWLDAEYLAIGAAYHCFHVNETPSRKAKRSLAYHWGNLAFGTHRIAGRLLDSQPGQGGTLVWNLTHSVDAPIAAANLTLTSAATKAAYKTTSDASGAFAFDGIPNGTYVLHIDAGKVGPERDFEGSDQLIKLASAEKIGVLVLKRRKGDGTNCGGTTFEMQGLPGTI
jgi:carboxypeptidase family protein